MAFLANRSVTQRNTAVVASTLTGSTITTSVMTASTLIGSTTTTSVLGFSTLTGSSIIGTSGQIGSLGYSTLSGSSIVGTVGQIGSLGIGIDPLEGLHSRNVIIVGSTSHGLLRLTTSDGVNYIQSGLSTTGSSVAPLHFTGYYGGPLHMAISSNGSVGIGTSSPQSALDVNGVISVGTGANVGGQGININTGWINPLDYYEWAPFKVSVRSNPVFNVNTQGYVGIGTTAPMNRIHIHSATGNYDPGIAITHSTTTGVLTWGLAGGVGSYAGNAVAGDAIFRNDDASKKVHLLAGTGNAVMTITSSSVGIGTTTPIGSLEIKSTINYSALSTNPIPGNLFLTTTTGDQRLILGAAYTGGTGSASYIQSSDFYNSVDNVGPLILNPLGGNVGIGTTNPLSALTIVNGESIYIGNSTASAFRFHHNTSNQSFLDFGSGDLFIRTSTGIATEVNRLVITSGGNVGIGISTPNAPLQLSNTIGNRRIVLWENTNNDHQFFGFGINSATLRYQVDAAAANHVFYAAASSTTSTELMRIQGNGNVGIGIGTAITKLHVYDSSGTCSVRLQTSGVDNSYIVSGNESIFISANYSSTGVRENIARGSSQIVCHCPTSGGFITFNTSSAINTNVVERMRIQGDGNVGIGTATPGAYKLYVQGDIYASGNITGLSDRRFKTNIEPLVGALDAVTALNGYTYFRPDHRPEERQMGLIAQEVQEVYPEAVTYDKENDRYGVNYNAMIAPLVQAVKEMRSEYCAQINHLKEEISSLKARLSV